MSTEIPLSRRPHLRPMSTLTNATASSSKLDSDATSGSPVGQRALLVGHAFDADLRRAGLDLIRRTRTVATRRRSAIVRGSASGLERDLSRIGPMAATVELHVLILDSGKQKDEDEAITTRCESSLELFWRVTAH